MIFVVYLGHGDFFIRLKQLYFYRNQFLGEGLELPNRGTSENKERGDHSRE